METTAKGRRSAGWTCRTRWADYSHDLVHTDSEPTGRRRKDRAAYYATRVVLSLGTAVAR